MTQKDFSSHPFLTSIAEENARLIRAGAYTAGGAVHRFSPRIRDVMVFPQSRRVMLTAWGSSQRSRREAKITVAAGDTSEYAGDAVLNFASATTPGGGYLHGSRAQEECLCRETTLYASLTAQDAAPLYEENHAKQSLLYTHTFLVSPHVEIFRRPMEEGYAFLSPDAVRTTAVLTVPAPNLAFLPAGFPREKVAKTMQDRIRHFLSGAARLGYRTLTLGAWGCGAFRHDAIDVAADFRRVLIDEHWQSLFDAITFAVYPGGEVGRYNLDVFRKVFRC